MQIAVLQIQMQHLQVPYFVYQCVQNPKVLRYKKKIKNKKQDLWSWSSFSSLYFFDCCLNILYFAHSYILLQTVFCHLMFLNS